MDTLENGQASAYAEFSGIEWRPAKPELRGKLRVPLLGDHYGAVLEVGQLQLAWDDASGRFVPGYHERRFPIDPCSDPRIPNRDSTRCRRGSRSRILIPAGGTAAAP